MALACLISGSPFLWTFCRKLAKPFWLMNGKSLLKSFSFRSLAALLSVAEVAMGHGLFKGARAWTVVGGRISRIWGKNDNHPIVQLTPMKHAEPLAKLPCESRWLSFFPKPPNPALYINLVPSNRNRFL